MKRLLDVIRWPLGFLKHPRAGWTLALVYLLILIAMLVKFFLDEPIVSYDTDLWYHLTGGVQILLHGAIPTDSYFSFLEPRRVWVDYYWLFQVIVAALHQGFGYYGLIALRMILSVGMLAVVMAYLARGYRQRQDIVALILLSSVYMAVLIPRLMNLRPHHFSYLLLAIMLYVLEWAPRRVLWLVPLAILWANLHGIVYPVMLTIIGAYALEHLVLAWRARRVTREAWACWTTLALAALAVVCTPHGVRLLPVPFRSTAYASMYIGELAPFGAENFTSLAIFNLTVTQGTLFTLLVIAAVAIIVLSFRQRTFRISHLALFIVGLLLLPKAVRFMYECVLLSLPLLTANVSVTRLVESAADSPSGSRLRKVVVVALLALAIWTPLRTFRSQLEPRAAFPMSRRGLPTGLCDFLRHVDTGGRLLNHPNNGGYYQWRLYPRYRIFMDMEVPFLFRDEDFFLMDQTLRDATTMRTVLERYAPEFISFPFNWKEAAERLEEIGGYAPVFFDDEEVLYASRAGVPTVVERYELKALKPFELIETLGEVAPSLEKWSEDERLQSMREVRRMLEVDPTCRLSNQLAAVVLLDEKRYDHALAHAHTIVTTYPEWSLGYRLEAEAWGGLGAQAKAMTALESASIRAPDATTHHWTQWYKGHLLLESGDYQSAYAVLKDAVKPFQGPGTAQQLRDRGVVALRLGRREEAKQFLRFAALKTSPDEPLRKDIEAHLKEMDAFLQSDPWFSNRSD